MEYGWLIGAAFTYVISLVMFSHVEHKARTPARLVIYTLVGMGLTLVLWPVLLVMTFWMWHKRIIQNISHEDDVHAVGEFIGLGGEFDEDDD